MSNGVSGISASIGVGRVGSVGVGVSGVTSSVGVSWGSSVVVSGGSSGIGNSLDWSGMNNWCSSGNNGSGNGNGFLVDVGFSSDLLVNVGFGSDFLMNVGFSFDFFMNVGFGFDFFMNVGLSFDFLMEVRLGSGINLTGIIVRVDGGHIRGGGSGSISYGGVGCITSIAVSSIRITSISITSWGNNASAGSGDQRENSDL